MSTTTTRRGPAREGRGSTAPSKGKPARPAPKPSSGGSAAARRSRAPRIPFVLLVLFLLGAALMSLLVLRSVVAQEAYAITSLQSQNQELSYQEQQLQDEVAHLENTDRIAEEAEDMGMEQGEAPLFLDPDKGEVIGGQGGAE